MMAGPVAGTDHLALADRAIAAGDFAAALAALDAVDESSPAAVELRATACYGAGDLDGTLEAWEALHALAVADGDRAEAARAAVMLAMYLMMDTGLMSSVRGWLRRAERLLADADPGPTDAMAAMVHTYERLMCGDAAGTRTWSQVAIELGMRHDALPAATLGRVAAARLRTFDGDLEAGLRELDDVAVLLMSGELDPLTTGMVWCELICAVQGLGLHDRAIEWTEMMERWRHGAAFGGIHGRCRVHRAEMFRLRGGCDQAEEEALHACEELRPWMRREFGWPLTELGTIRLRRGDLAGAQEAFLAAHEHAWDPQPGLALLRLAQGDLAGATAMIDAALTRPVAVPSKERPPIAGPFRAPLLEAQVEIAVAAGDHETAGAAAQELQRISDTVASPALGAAASLARGRVALAGGDAVEAVHACEDAVAAWGQVGVPFEAAQARLVLGHAHRAYGNEPCARLEWQAALSTFQRLGAQRHAHVAAAVLDAAVAEPVARSEATGPGSPCVFRRDGDTRTVTFAGRTVLLRDLKGLRYLERLLAEPNREFHALDLVAVDRGSLPVDRTGAEGLRASDGGDAGPMLDAQARRAYRRRLAEADQDIADAERCNDPERRALAEVDREYLMTELRRAVGFGGRVRHAGDTSERARTSVTRAIRYALARIRDHHGELADHLDHAVQTGIYCGYTPDPRAPIRWDV